jgi:hypothetical protein
VFKRNMGRITPIGLKRILGSRGFGQVFKSFYSMFRGAWLRAGSRRWGFRPSVKKANKSGHVPGSGSDYFLAGLGYDLSSQGISLPLVAISPVPEAVGLLGLSSDASVASPVVVPPLPVGFASVGFGF